LKRIKKQNTIEYKIFREIPDIPIRRKGSRVTNIGKGKIWWAGWVCSACGGKWIEYEDANAHQCTGG